MLWEFEKFNFSTTVYYLDAEEVRSSICILGGILNVSQM
jgi:hypothetical protein